MGFWDIGKTILIGIMSRQTYSWADCHKLSLVVLFGRNAAIHDVQTFIFAQRNHRVLKKPVRTLFLLCLLVFFSIPQTAGQTTTDSHFSQIQSTTTSIGLSDFKDIALFDSELYVA
ncbi:MAG: hypothetical protein D6732_26780, partial [Methanobacteriota archaeon]